MATSDSPLNVPNVTLAVARGASSSVLQNGQQVTLTGSWAAVANPSALLIDEYASGVDGADIQGSYLFFNSGGTSFGNPKQTEQDFWSGNSCAKVRLMGADGQYSSAAALVFPSGAESAYASYRFKGVKHSAAESRNIKLARITANSSPGTFDQPSIGFTQQYNDAPAYCGTGDPNLSAGFLPNIYPGNHIAQGVGWQRVQMGGILSDPAVSNGSWLYYRDSNGEIRTSVPTRHYAGEQYRKITLPYYVAKEVDTLAVTDYELLWDDLFLTTNCGFARVEISNSQTYSESESEPVNTTRRTTTEADITLRQGGAVDFSLTVYAYIFEPDGTRISYGAIN